MILPIDRNSELHAELASGVLVHGPWPPLERDPNRAPNWLPCCDTLIADAAPGIVSRDPELVTCQGDPLLRELMEAMLQPIDETASASSIWPLMLREPRPDPRIGIRILALAIPQLQWWEHDGRLFYTTGVWLRLKGGTLDIGIIRDFAHGFGDRWRPWKRHLHRLGPRVWRLFGWRPIPPALDLHLVRDSRSEARNDYSVFVEEWDRPWFVRQHINVVEPPPLRQMVGGDW
jgi:hypothetical protein